MVPMIAPRPWPAFASFTLITYAPLPAAARRYWPSLVIASLFFAPGAGIVATCFGASEPPSLLRTATELPSETNEYLPSGVTATPKGWPPRPTFWLATPGICGAVAAALLSPGILEVSPLVILPLPSPCADRTTPATIPRITTTAAASRAPRDRHHGGRGAPPPPPPPGPGAAPPAPARPRLVAPAPA